MKEVVFVTSNQGKIAYAKDLMPDTKIIQYDYDLIEPRGDDVKKIAIEKVKQAYEKTNRPCIAMDIGFFIRSLNGFPRAYVNHALDTIGIEGIMTLMEGKTDRYCEFRECLAYYDGTLLEVFESIGPSTITDTIRGRDQVNKLSDLWYIVVPDGYNKTLAEFTKKDFDDHRKQREASCLKLFGDWYLLK